MSRSSGPARPPHAIGADERTTRPSGARGRRVPAFPVPAVIAALLATAFAMAPVLVNGFTWWDDQQTIHQNPLVREPTAAGFLHYWTTPVAGLYAPLTWSAWQGLALLARRAPGPDGIPLDPRVFHAGSFAVHLATVAMLYLLLRRLLRDPVAAAAGAALFGVHPLQVEAVAWASGLKDLLSAFFALTALYLHGGAESVGSSPAKVAVAAGCADGELATQASRPNPRQVRSFRGGSHTLRATMLALGCFVLALLAKPAVMVIPLIAAVLDVGLLRRPWGVTLRRLAPWAAVAAGFAVLARVAQNPPPAAAPGLWLRPLVATDALAFYLGKLAFPAGLAIDYGRLPSVVLSRQTVLVSWIVPAALAVALWMWKPGRPWLPTAGAVFALALAPVLGLTPFSMQEYSTTADHYLYLAMAGPALAFGWLAVRRPPGSVAVAVVVVIAFGVMSFRQTQVWKNDVALFARALAVNPRSFAAHVKLGFIFRNAAEGELAVAQVAAREGRGDAERLSHERAGRLLGAAEEHFTKAVDLNPTFVRGLDALGDLRADQGRLVEAAELRERAAAAHEALPEQLRGGLPAARLRAGEAWVAAGRCDRATPQLEAVLALDPGNAAATAGQSRCR